MANRRFYQFLYSTIPMLTMVEGQLVVGATGAVTTVSGAGVQGITRLAAGTYRITLVDNYNAYIGSIFSFQDGVTGSAIADGSFVATTLYQITTVGTTNWAAVGLPAGLTPAVGMSFVATGVGGAGSGFVKAVANSGIVTVNLASNGNSMLAPSTGGAGGGGIGASFVIQTLSATNTVADPVNLSVMNFSFLLRNSSNSF